MRHLGDITKLKGNEVPIVDIVVGGSPCQDLSVAGKRAGLAGERSGLFMEQIRIIKEMREHDRASGRPAEFIRPRFMVWENVPGAFSSNKGEDFRAVLEETARIAKEDAIIPGLEGGEKWRPAGCIMGDGWSIAWRLHDAQFWGVPQRRKRIALVADFGGQSAPKILFERKGMPGNPAESEEPRQGTAGATEEGSYCTSGGITSEPYAPATTKESETKASEKENSSSSIYDVRISQSRDDSEQNPVYCLQGNGIDREDTAGCNGKGWRENQSYTLNTIDRPAVCAVENHPADSRVKISKDGTVQTLSSRMGTGGGNVPMVMSLNSKQQGLDTGIEEEKIGAQVARGQGAVCKSVVRRLTPMECERLQGYPDGWTDIGDWIDSKGKTHKGDSDAPRYKALGNSIALPFWEWMAKRICREYDRPTTMASLFDGIGGFPLVFSKHGCTPVWASEIEEFPIAVTKIRFPEEEEQK